MTEQKAIYYGQIELIPDIICDGYVLDNNTAVMSERGVADLLGIYHYTLQSMANKGIPKALKPFVDESLGMVPKSIEVVAKNSPYQGRKINVYTTPVIESLIRGYALGLANDTLRQNQQHIGKRSVILQSSLVRTALDAAVKQACGLSPNIQKIAQ